MEYAINTRSQNVDYGWQYSDSQIQSVSEKLSKMISDKGKGVVVFRKDSVFYVYIAGLIRLGNVPCITDKAGRQVRVGLVLKTNQATAKGIVCALLEHWDDPGKLFPEIVEWKDNEHWEHNSAKVDDAVTKIGLVKETGIEFPYRRFGTSDRAALRLIQGELTNYFDWPPKDGVKLVIENGSVMGSVAEEIRAEADVYLNGKNPPEVIMPKSQPENQSRGIFKYFFPFILGAMLAGGLGYYFSQQAIQHWYVANEELRQQIETGKSEIRKVISESEMVKSESKSEIESLKTAQSQTIQNIENEKKQSDREYQGKIDTLLRNLAERDQRILKLGGMDIEKLKMEISKLNVEIGKLHTETQRLIGEKTALENGIQEQKSILDDLGKNIEVAKHERDAANRESAVIREMNKLAASGILNNIAQILWHNDDVIGLTWLKNIIENRIDQLTPKQKPLPPAAGPQPSVEVPVPPKKLPMEAGGE